MFKIKIEKAEPESVKISKKNICIVKIAPATQMNSDMEEHTKLMQYFVEQSNPSWGGQFLRAVKLCPQIDEDDLIVEGVSGFEAFMHFATMGWKVLFSCIPPVKMHGGWPAFFVAITFIGLITAVVAEAATILGCNMNLKESVTAITLVAIGTSLPDTFASRTAALNSEFADAAIGNVTGSNSVNIFVGLGLPWVMATLNSETGIYIVPQGSLSFSVALFLATSVTCFLILVLRRTFLGGELGGPDMSRIITTIIMICLWLIYVVMSSLKAYGKIEGF